MLRTVPIIAVAAVVLVASAAGLHGSPTLSAPSSLGAADARLRAALAGAATAAQPAPDAEAQNARLVAADAALDAMAAVPAADRADLDRKAAALILVGDFEVNEGWRLAGSLARDTLRLDTPSLTPQGK